MKKPGRNDPCWCNSGKKFKRCHIDRELEPRPTPQELNSAFKKSFGKEYCIHPQASKQVCKSKIAEAHTIQRKGGGLSRIARKGHVYTFEARTGELIKGNETSFVTPVGLAKASTFTGFCSFHDNRTFEPLEKRPFVGNLEQIFLLGYRSICRELFLKKAQQGLTPSILLYDRGMPFAHQVSFQDNFQAYGNSVEMGVRDFEHHKAKYDKALVSSDFSSVWFYLITMDKCPEIMCTGSLFPEVDFNGKTLQRLTQPNILDQISFSLFATANGGVAVFTWLDENEPGKQFIQSLHQISDHDLPHAIVRFAFDCIENTYFSPDWWESLASEEQATIQERASFFGSYEIAPTRLLDDGIRTVSWTIKSRETNIPK